MKEDKIEPFTSFYRKVVFADKVFDVNFQEIAKVLFNEVDRLNSIIKEVREYIEKDTRWFDSGYAKTYGELCTCTGANDTRLEVLVNPSNLLEILDKVGE